MKVFLIILGILAGIAVLFFLVVLLCFLGTFFTPHINFKSGQKPTMPPGKIYKPFRRDMLKLMEETRNIPHKSFYIHGENGCKLHGKYYECKPGAPIEILVHGYRGTSERDLCGGVQRCFALGRNALLIDQRGSGKSHGHLITFGIRERYDCLAWVDFVIDRFGPDTKIILGGISMGAATVLMTADMELPENVIGILADCGYTSPKEIIQKVIRQFHLPVNPVYKFIKLGAKFFGGFDIEETSPMEALKNCRVPVIFIHGEDDNFVPCEMSRKNFNACVSEKFLLTVPDAGHGLSFLVDYDAYMDAARQHTDACLAQTVNL